MTKLEESVNLGPNALKVHHLVLSLALTLTFAAYYGTLGFDFVYDDRAQIVENPLAHSWRYVPRYFTEHVWASIIPGSVGNYYRPMFLLWLRLNHAIFGLRPWGWHLTTALCHLGVTLLVYFLAAKLLRDRVDAAVVALIFGVHPVHLEGVAWVSGVTEPLMALFFVPAFICYLNGRETGRRRTLWQAASLLLYAAAMLTKETALVLPLLIFIYEWIFAAPAIKPDTEAQESGRLWTSILRVVPFGLLTMAYLIQRFRVLEGFGHRVTDLSLATILFTWPSLLWFYFKLLVWPPAVSPFHLAPYVTVPGLANFLIPVSAVIVIVVLLARLARYSDLHAVGFASAWLVMPMIPLLDLRVISRGELVHDRYLYLPSIGFAMLAALAMKLALRRKTMESASPLMKVILPATIALVLTVMTVFQSSVYANDLVYYSRGVAEEPENENLMVNFANVLADRGMYGEAIALYNHLRARDPGSWPANYNLGHAYFQMGKLDEAEEYLKRAIVSDPQKPVAYLFLGGTYLKENRLDDAAAAIRQGIRLDPVPNRYHLALGLVLKLQNNLAGAVEEFKAEIAIEPNQAAVEQIAEISAQVRHP